MMYGGGLESSSTTRVQSGSTVDSALRLKVRGLEKSWLNWNLRIRYFGSWSEMH